MLLMRVFNVFSLVTVCPCQSYVLNRCQYLSVDNLYAMSMLHVLQNRSVAKSEGRLVGSMRHRQASTIQLNGDFKRYTQMRHVFQCAAIVETNWEGLKATLT